MRPNHRRNTATRGRLATDIGGRLPDLSRRSHTKAEAQRAKPARMPGVLPISFALAIACAILPTLLHADTVEMKSGRVIENCETRKRGQSIVIDTGTAVFTVPMAQIERIEERAVKREEPTPAPAPTEAAATATPTAFPEATPTPEIYIAPNTPPGHEPKVGLNPKYRPDPAMVRRFRAELEKINQEAIDSWDFDLEREIARVMLDPRVPRVWDKTWPHYAKWQRESYLPIINAARTAFHKHRNPKTGAPGLKTETITVPGNITGKDTLRIRYESGCINPQDNAYIWGDDEDIVYLTGGRNFTPNQTLKIMPGTLVLVASFQDDQREGPLDEAIVNELKTLFAQDQKKTGPKPNVTEAKIFEGRIENLGGFGVDGGPLLARGEVGFPILIVSDAQEPTPFDFFLWHFVRGVVDHVVTENSVYTNSRLETVNSRNRFDIRLGTHTSSPCYHVGNYMGSCRDESIDMFAAKDTPFIIYNVFQNKWCVGKSLTLFDGIVVASNSYVDMYGNCIQFLNQNASPHVQKDARRFWNEDLSVLAKKTWRSRIVVKNNNFFSRPGQVVVNNGFPGTIIDMRRNYWGTTSKALINRKMRREDRGRIDIAEPNPYPDSDMDGVTDEKEARAGTDPRVMDTDQDGLIDGRDPEPLNPDTDGNGMPDGIDLYRTDYRKLVPTMDDF